MFCQVVELVLYFPDEGPFPEDRLLQRVYPIIQTLLVRLWPVFQDSHWAVYPDGERQHQQCYATVCTLRALNAESFPCESLCSTQCQAV